MIENNKLSKPRVEIGTIGQSDPSKTALPTAIIKTINLINGENLESDLINSESKIEKNSITINTENFKKNKIKRKTKKY